MEFILCYSFDNRWVTCDVGNTEYLISSGVQGSSLRETSLAIPYLLTLMRLMHFSLFDSS